MADELKAVKQENKQLKHQLNENKNLMNHHAEESKDTFLSMKVILFKVRNTEACL